MIGLILTGHGDFSKGLISSLRMIAGEQSHIKAIVFDANEDLENYKKNIRNQIEDFLEKYEGIIILTDIPGGTPFNISVIESENTKNLEVISGTNLPMLIDVTLKSQFIDDVHELTDEILNTGKETIIKFQLHEDKVDEIEGGI